MKTLFSSVFAMGAALALHDGERLFTMDMVHHNPGDKPTESRFLDPAYLAEMGSGAKVVNDFRYPQCACTFEEFDAEIFPAGSPERKWVDDFAAEVEAKARDCHEKGLECHYFMDIIVLPRRLIEKYRSEICGEDGRVSFEREKTWEIHRLMIREMLRRIPSVDGYVIRTGEMYSHNVPYHGGNTPLDFRKPLDGFVDTHTKLMNLLREEICVKGGKKVFYRTWDFRRFHIRPDLYLAITDQVEPHEKLFLSIKHTAGDYLRYVPFNPTLGIGKHKQIVEVQCQREYEGKGAYPNYVVKGVVEGFEENAACPGIQGLGEFLKDSRFAGVWTWSRGGGWEGPYLKNELWCAMNAFVMTEWANHPEAGEEVAFGKFMDRIGVAAESRDAFHKLAVLSAEAVVRGMGYMPDEKLTACWTRDHFIGGFGDPELDADANRLVKESKVAASLANRRAAVERWREIVRLADLVKIADKAAESYVRVSSRYGLHLYRIYEAGWTAMLLTRQREVTGKTDEAEIAAAIGRYDDAWRDYRALASEPTCATLFDDHFAEYHISQDHNSIDPIPGMGAEVDKARKLLRERGGLVTESEAEAMARAKLAQMTLEEKASLCGLCATMYLNAIPRVGIDREWAFSDGSHGLKPEHNRDRWGYIGGVDDRSTSMPCMSALASTWNRALAAKHGDVMGSQMRSRNKDQMLGPGLNVMRNPLCGRNWEYMSEDPLVISQMSVPLIQAAQSHGLACTPKHYCLNSQELNRFDTCSTVDSRALHEIYLPAFEAAVKGGALSLMTAYNRYNGTYCSESSYLQRALLREQWGFRGTIVTDWGGQHSCDNAVLNGGGMEANCGNKVTHLTDFYGTNGGDKYPLATSVKEGRVPESVVDEMAMRTLYVMAKTGFLSGSQDKGERLVERHREVARAIGEEAIILAKNAKGVLPLEKAKTRKLVVFGQVARLKQAEFGSSCECHVVSEISFLDGLREYLGGSCEIAYYPLGGEVGEGEKAADEGEKGYDIGGIVALTAAGKEPRVPLAQLRGECAAADAVLVFTGTTMGFGQAQETEGEDRPNMKSAPGHDEEIAEILSWELPRTVVVCRAGSALELPWLGDCDTMLLASYLGQEAGRPMAKVLFGDVNPSGKLTFTWPKRYADTPTGFFGERAYNATNSVYLEGVYVGYRWYEKRGIPVDFPFGYGLSYTDFRLRTSDIRNCGGDFIVKVDVANVGGRDGAEVVQLYVAAKEPEVDRPVKELKGFEKVFLGKGETKTVEFRITPRDLAYWDAFASCFRADAGTYALQVGTSSSDIRDSADIVLEEGREFK